MTEPISSAASIITIAGSALESVHILLKFFHRFRHAPNQVRRWLTILESLCSTLSSLQQCGLSVDQRQRFSTHFRQRLLGCVIQLRIAVEEVVKINQSLVIADGDEQRRWDKKARRSWERAKWAVVGDGKIKRLMVIMNMYHFEFAMELMKVLMIAQGTSQVPANVSSKTDLNRQDKEQRITPLTSPREYPRTSQTAAAHTISKPLESAETSKSVPRIQVSQAFVRHNCSYGGPDPFSNKLGADQKILPIISLRWSSFGFLFTIQASSIIRSYDQMNKAQFYNLGFRFSLHVHLPGIWRRKLGPTQCLFQLISSRAMNNLHWSLEIPRTVSPEADVFKYARAGRIEEIRSLFSIGKASPKDVTPFGTTLLHSASRTSNVELVRLLIQEGADVNAQDVDGESPAHGALAKAGNHDIARILIENNADLSAQTSDKQTPLHNFFNDTIAYVLMKEDWLERMLVDSDGMAITHYLAWSSKSTVDVFERGRLSDNIDLLTADGQGRTCLHLAASRGNLDVLSHILKQLSVSDMDKKDYQGRTALHYAAESSRSVRVIDKLVDNGCNVYATDGKGWTALHWAARWSNFEAVKKLISMGERVKLLSYDSGGSLPSQVVRQQSSPDLFWYLEDVEASSGVSSEVLEGPSPQEKLVDLKAMSVFYLRPEILWFLFPILILLLGLPD